MAVGFIYKRWNFDITWLAFASSLDFVYDLNQFLIITPFLLCVICEAKGKAEAVSAGWTPRSTLAAISAIHSLSVKSFTSVLGGNKIKKIKLIQA